MDVNWIAIVVAGASALLLGGLWYSPPLFAKAWMAAAGLSEEQARSGSMPLIFDTTLLLSLIAAASFAMFLGRHPSLPFALGAGACAGICWVAAFFGINYLFERRPLKLFLINGGYGALQFTLYGAILSLLD